MSESDISARFMIRAEYSFDGDQVFSIYRRVRASWWRRLIGGGVTRWMKVSEAFTMDAAQFELRRLIEHEAIREDPLRYDTQGRPLG